MMISHHAPAGPVIQVTDSRIEKTVKIGEAEVVHPDPAVHVADPPEAHHQHGGDHEESHDQPEQVAGVLRLQRVELDALEDVGQGDQQDRRVDRDHQHAERGVRQRDPLVGGRSPARAPRRSRVAGPRARPRLRMTPPGRGQKERFSEVTCLRITKIGARCRLGPGGSAVAGDEAGSGSAASHLRTLPLEPGEFAEVVLRGALRDPAGPGRLSRFHRAFPRPAARRAALDRADQPPAAGAAPPRSRGLQGGRVVRRLAGPPARSRASMPVHGRQPRRAADGQREGSGVAAAARSRRSRKRSAWPGRSAPSGADTAGRRLLYPRGADPVLVLAAHQPRRGVGAGARRPRDPPAGVGGQRHPRGDLGRRDGGRAPEGQARAPRVDGRDHHRRLHDGRRGQGRPRRDAGRGRRRPPTGAGSA